MLGFLVCMIVNFCGSYVDLKLFEIFGFVFLVVKFGWNGCGGGVVLILMLID